MTPPNERHPVMPNRHKVILDTDIGTDVDDLMALALILGTPSIELLGITTVYGDTRLRAQLTQRIVGTVGREIPIHAGLQTPWSGKEVWWAGHEGALHSDLERERYDSDDAVAYLIDTVCAHPGEVDLIAIGPLTNIAEAIRVESRFSRAVRHLWVMGGAFQSEECEHNFRSDATAAATVFSAGIPTTVTGLEVTRTVEIGAEELASIAASAPLGPIIKDEIEQWWRFWDTVWNVPHDPITVLTLTRPELFAFSPHGTISIDTEVEVGMSRHKPGPGKTRVSTWVDARAAAEAMVAGMVLGAASHGDPDGARR